MIPLYMNGRNVPLPHRLEGAVFLEETFLHVALHIMIIIIISKVLIHYIHFNYEKLIEINNYLLKEDTLKDKRQTP